MVYALREPGPDAARLRELLSGPIDDDAAVAEALTLLRASPGMAKAKQFLADYADQARRELTLLPDVPGRDAAADPDRLHGQPARLAPMP